MAASTNSRSAAESRPLKRDLIRTRVRDGMTVLAESGNRHLGGRPPYGYRLADAGEHPNAKKRALGQRLHRLEPDPVTAPVVRRIFELFANGQGLKQIANTLTADNIPSPSAHDRKRNRNRDPRGWAHSAVRTILRNEKYLGRAVWGKQVRTDELYDLDDVAAGYITRQRWTDRENWTYSPDGAHPALIDQDHQLANLASPDRLSPADVEALITELGGLSEILGEATPPEKASIYQGLGLHLVYQPDQSALVATADLGRVVSRVGGGTLPAMTRAFAPISTG